MQVAVGAYVGTAALTDFNLATGRSFFPQALSRHVWPATPGSQGNIGTGGLLPFRYGRHWWPATPYPSGMVDTGGLPSRTPQAWWPAIPVFEGAHPMHYAWRKPTLI